MMCRRSGGNDPYAIKWSRPMQFKLQLLVPILDNGQWHLHRKKIITGHFSIRIVGQSVKTWMNCNLNVHGHQLGNVEMYFLSINGPWFH